jgi:hypothetical protein
MPMSHVDQDLIPVNLKWPLESDLQTVYANQFAISATGPEFVLEFGEFLPTGFANRPREEVEGYLTNAMVKPVARIVVSKEGLEALHGLLGNYIEARAERKDAGKP